MESTTSSGQRGSHVLSQYFDFDHWLEISLLGCQWSKMEKMISHTGE